MTRQETAHGVPILYRYPTIANQYQEEGEIVLCKIEDDAPQPYVVWWMRARDGATMSGSYWTTFKEARESFQVRVLEEANKFFAESVRIIPTCPVQTDRYSPKGSSRCNVPLKVALIRNDSEGWKPRVHFLCGHTLDEIEYAVRHELFTDPVLTIPLLR